MFYLSKCREYWKLFEKFCILTPNFYLCPNVFNRKVSFTVWKDSSQNKNEILSLFEFQKTKFHSEWIFREVTYQYISDNIPIGCWNTRTGKIPFEQRQLLRHVFRVPLIFHFSEEFLQCNSYFITCCIPYVALKKIYNYKLFNTIYICCNRFTLAT